MKVQLRLFSKEEKWITTLSVSEETTKEERVEVVTKVDQEVKVDYWFVGDKVKEYFDGTMELLSKEEIELCRTLPEGEKSYMFTKKDDKGQDTQEQIYESELTEKQTNSIVGTFVTEWNNLPKNAQITFLRIVNTQMAVNAVLEGDVVTPVLYPNQQDHNLILTIAKTDGVWAIERLAAKPTKEMIQEGKVLVSDTAGEPSVISWEPTTTEFFEFVKKAKR